MGNETVGFGMQIRVAVRGEDGVDGVGGWPGGWDGLDGLDGLRRYGWEDAGGSRSCLVASASLGKGSIIRNNHGASWAGSAPCMRGQQRVKSPK